MIRGVYVVRFLAATVLVLKCDRSSSFIASIGIAMRLVAGAKSVGPLTKAISRNRLSIAIGFKRDTRWLNPAR